MAPPARFAELTDLRPVDLGSLLRKGRCGASPPPNRAPACSSSGATSGVRTCGEARDSKTGV